MAITWDIIDGAVADIGVQGATVVRAAHISDIPAQSRSDPNVLMRAMFEMGGPKFGETHPYIKSLRLRRIVVKPGGSTNDASAQYHYEGPAYGALPASWNAIYVVEDDATLATEIEEVDPDGAVIQATYEVFGEFGSADGFKVPKTGPVPVLRPRRQLSVSGMVFGRTAPSAWSRDALGTVNNAPWPSGSLWANDKPLPKGYWLCTHVSASVDRYFRDAPVFDEKTAPYRVRASFQSKVRRDWGHLILYRDRYGNVPKGMTTPASLKALQMGEYEVGQKTIQGATKTGQYATENFPQKFGF